MKFPGHRGIMGKYDMTPMVLRIQMILPTIGGRKNFLHALKMMILLESHVQHYSRIMGPSHAKVADVGESRDVAGLLQSTREILMRTSRRQ